jgi:hypothetical protein
MIYSDKEIEKLYSELEDATMIEKDGEVVLSSNFYHFEVETSQSDIWLWIDSHYSKGLGYLNDNIDIIRKEALCDCSKCNKSCIHKGAFRRLPRPIGLSLCPNLKEER